jgi:signal peptidase I
MPRWTRAIVEGLALLVVVTVAKSAIAEPYYVPSGSMEPTLQIGDALLATKYPYGYSSASLPIFITLPNTPRVLGALPRRGDIVVFRWPGERGKIGVKRVIGLPGDRIAMVHGRVYINRKAVALKADGVGYVEFEDGMQQPIARFIETLPGGRSHTLFEQGSNGAFDNIPELIVPQDRLFVMGDNRDNSADSRVPVAMGGVGLLPVSALVGRVDALVGSWDPAVANEPIWDWLSGLRPSRFFAAIH